MLRSSPSVPRVAPSFVSASWRKAQRLSAILTSADSPGNRVATLMWNQQEHLEAYFGFLPWSGRAHVEPAPASGRDHLHRQPCPGPLGRSNRRAARRIHESLERRRPSGNFRDVVSFRRHARQPHQRAVDRAILQQPPASHQSHSATPSESPRSCFRSQFSSPDSSCIASGSTPWTVRHRMDSSIHRPRL